MFNIGDTVVYGINGVYTISNITHSPFNPSDTRDYYVLKPMFGPDSSTIYTPCENKTVIMRELMSEDEILALINKIPDIPALNVEVEKQRKEAYRTAVLTADLESYVGVIKAVGLRREKFNKAKKHLPNTDIDYEAIAKHRIREEIAAVLEMNIEEIDDFIKGKLGISE